MPQQENIVNGMITVHSGQPSAKILEPVAAGTLDIKYAFLSEADIEKAGGHFHEKTYTFSSEGINRGGNVANPSVYSFKIGFLTKDNETGKDLPQWRLSGLSAFNNAWHPTAAKNLTSFAPPH